MPAIDSRSLVDRVYDHLMEQIRSGEIAHGQAVSVRKVASELGLSTMPVREALKRLAFERVVTIKPRSSCTVLAPSAQMISDVYELRELIEVQAITKAAAAGLDRSALERLDGIVAEMRSLDRETDAAAHARRQIELDGRFHAEICAMAGNEYMNAVHRTLSVHVTMALIHERTDYMLAYRYAESHDEILRALRTDPSSAVEVLRQHFKRVRDVLVASSS
jgi:DNA-binding GntR family transcriptional regulator